MCIKNRDDISIYGNYGSKAASVLMIVWERCNPAVEQDSECANEKDYLEFTKAAYILTLEN